MIAAILIAAILCAFLMYCCLIVGNDDGRR